MATRCASETEVLNKTLFPNKTDCRQVKSESYFPPSPQPVRIVDSLILFPAESFKKLAAEKKKKSRKLESYSDYPINCRGRLHFYWDICDCDNYVKLQDVLSDVTITLNEGETSEKETEESNPTVSLSPSVLFKSEILSESTSSDSTLINVSSITSSDSNRLIFQCCKTADEFKKATFLLSKQIKKKNDRSAMLNNKSDYPLTIFSADSLKLSELMKVEKSLSEYVEFMETITDEYVRMIKLIYQSHL